MTEILYGIAIYYAIGVLWLTTGFMPRGWLKHEWSPQQAALIVLIGGVLWLPMFLLFFAVIFFGTETRS